MTQEPEPVDRLEAAVAVVQRLRTAIHANQHNTVDNRGHGLSMLTSCVPADCANDVKAAVVAVLQSKLDYAQVALREEAKAYVEQYQLVMASLSKL